MRLEEAMLALPNSSAAAAQLIVPEAWNVLAELQHGLAGHQLTSV